MRLGCALGSGSAPNTSGPEAEPGAQPHWFLSCLRQGRALPHIRAAKPVRMTS